MPKAFLKINFEPFYAIFTADSNRIVGIYAVLFKICIKSPLFRLELSILYNTASNLSTKIYKFTKNLL